MGSNLTIDQIEKLVKAQAGVPMMLGEPGAGKSEIAAQIAERNGWGFIDLRLAQMDQSEVTGLYDRKDDHVVLRPQEWAIRANEKPTLVFFDELNRATREVRNAALQVFHERRLGWSFTFNKNVYFLAAGNKGDGEDGDRTDVEEFDDALKNRIIPIEINVHEKDWCDQWMAWATEHKVHKNILDFIKKFPQYLFNRGTDTDKAFATARSWTYFSKLLTSNGVEKFDDVLAYTQYYSHLYIGGPTSVKFKKYLEEQKAVTYQDILNNWAAVKDVIKEATRDKVSEILFDLKAQDINKFSYKQIDNITDFCKMIDPDEVTGYIYSLGENSFKFSENKATLKKDNAKLRYFLLPFKDILLRLQEAEEKGEKEEEKKK